MITHEDMDLRVGRSPAQSLSAKTVSVEQDLLRTCSFIQSKIQCAAQIPQETLRRDDVSFGRLRQGSRKTVRGECNVWSAWSQPLTLAHNASKCSMLFGTRVLLVVIVIVAVDSRRDRWFCVLQTVLVQHAKYILIGRQTPRWRRRIAGILHPRTSVLNWQRAEE